MGRCCFCEGILWPGQRRGFLTRYDGSQDYFHTQCLTDARRTLHPVYIRWQQELRAKEDEQL